MPPSNDYSDDFVADLLSKEAAECALKYSAVGMDAYTKSAKRPANHPTPNTRFLSNIVKATDSHNRNLLAQERADSQARLAGLNRTQEDERHAGAERERRRRPGPDDTRKRMLGDIKAIIGGPPKKRKTAGDGLDRDDESVSRRLKKPKEGQDIKIMGRARNGDDRNITNSSNTNAKKELFADHGPKRGYKDNINHSSNSSTRESSRHRHRSDDRKGDRSGTTKDRRSKGISAVFEAATRRQAEDITKSSSSNTKSNRATRNQQFLNDTSDDSDPLDDIIGPRPPSPVRRRGRGAASGSSGMDSRFSSAYDPQADVSLNHDEDDDDWGSALEALRDRQKWKEQGADRLRAAGFTEDQVKKWEKGDKKDESDVQWSKRGEQREWDRGKTLLKEEDGSL